MRTFKDSEGRTWTLDINFDSRNQIKAHAGVDILDIEQAQKLCVIGDMGDLDALGRVLYVLCEDQLKEKKIDERTFARGLKGDPFQSALDALAGELIDFFLPARRPMLEKAIGKAKQLQAMALDKADQILSSDQLDRQMLKLLNASSGTSPESAVSIPVTSRFDS